MYVMPTNELIRNIQSAYDGNRPDDKSFLNYLKNDLLSQAMVNHSDVWVEFLEVECGDGCIRLSTGEENLPNGSRLHKHSDTDYRYETRSVKKIAYIDFHHPTIDQIWGDVKECAIEAAVLTVITAILTEAYDVAMGIFYPIFYECLKEKIHDTAKEVNVEMTSETEYGCYKYHCP